MRHGFIVGQSGVGKTVLGCRRAFKRDHPCALNFDQGLRPPV
jgi:type IV secretory pathway VirB4 component